MRGRTTLGLLALGAGILWLLTAADVVDLDFTTWVGVLLIGLGLAIVFTRGRHGLLVVVGILVLLAGLPALLVDDDVVSGGIGDAVEEPRSSAELEPFRHGIGKLTVDLTDPALELDGATVEASVGIGELLVLVPDDVDLTIDAHVGAGHIQALEREEDGVDVDLDWITGTSGSEEVELDLDVGIGNLRVERAP